MITYKVYFLKDEFNNIKYCGQTRQSLKKRLISHKTSKRLPSKNITIQLVAEFSSPEPMYKLEAKLIEELNLVNNGWNKEYGKIKVPKQTSQSGENNQFYKHSHREEVRKAISLRSLGNKYAKNSKSRSGLKNSKKHNEAISLKNSKKVYCFELDVVFFSYKKAAEYLNVNESKISAVCRGERKSTGGYTFKFYNTMGS